MGKTNKFLPLSNQALLSKEKPLQPRESSIDVDDKNTIGSRHIFYVYAHYRSDGSVFYIGKGQRRRGWSHKNRSILWKRTVEKHGLRVEIWANDLTEKQAFGMEKEWIGLYGRRDLGTGCLVNLTSGGDGVSGLICTDETRAKMSNAKKGKLRSSETRDKIRVAKTGKPQTPNQIAATNARKDLPPTPAQTAAWALLKGKHRSSETRSKISSANKGKNRVNGRKHSPETRAKISAANKGKPGGKGRKHSPETRTRLSVISTGKTHLPETLAKMSANRKGKRHSPESRAKMSESKKGKPRSPAQLAYDERLRGKPLSPGRASAMIEGRARARSLHKESLLLESSSDKIAAYREDPPRPDSKK